MRGSLSFLLLLFIVIILEYQSLTLRVKVEILSVLFQNAIPAMGISNI